METEKKDRQRIFLEIKIDIMISDIKSLNKITGENINKLVRKKKLMIEAEADEFEVLKVEAEKLREAQEDVENDFKSLPESEEELKCLKAETEAVMKETEDIYKRIEEFRETFQKYNVPRLGESESSVEYTERLTKFMQTYWKKEAKKGRERGENNLIELLRFLKQSFCEAKTDTFKATRFVAVDLGMKISYPIARTLVLMSVSEPGEEIEKNLKDFVTILECLSVEENSVIIDTFSSLMSSVDWTTSLRKINCSSTYDMKRKLIEKGILHMVIREVLRFEVAFCCPDLHMLLTNGVIVLMGGLLRKVVDKNLSRIDLKLNELEMELSRSIRNEEKKKVESVLRELNEGIEEMWEKLNLHPQD